MKRCPKCGETKSVSEFGHSGSKKDGLQSWCKACNAEYRANHREETARYDAKYYSNHREEKAGYHANHREEKAEYYTANHERILRQQAEYRRGRRKESAEYERNRRANDTQYRLACNLRSRLGNAVRRGYKSGSAVRDLGCTIAELKEHLEKQFQPGMSWDNYGPAGWHIDHHRPLDSFNLEDRGQLLEACHYTNLQPMWASENTTKGAKILQTTAAEAR